MVYSRYRYRYSSGNDVIPSCWSCWMKSFVHCVIKWLSIISNGGMGQICGFLWTCKIEKAFSFRELRPLTPNRGLCLLDSRWRLGPQTPVIGSRSALDITSKPCQGPALTKAGYEIIFGLDQTCRLPCRLSEVSDNLRIRYDKRLLSFEQFRQIRTNPKLRSDPKKLFKKIKSTLCLKTIILNYNWG